MRPIAHRTAFEAQIPTEVLRQDPSRSPVHHEGEASSSTGAGSGISRPSQSGGCWKRAASEICKCEEVESGLGQTKPLKLQRPFGRRITQGGDADAARKPPFDGGLDQSRRDECHRYRHVDLTNAALLAHGNAFD